MRLPTLLLLVLLSWQCTGVRLERPTIVPQRTSSDCAIAALAMLAHVSYDRVDGVRASLGIDTEEMGGTPTSDMLLIAGQLGVRLIPLTAAKANPTHDTGIAIIMLGERWVHAVYVYRGQVYDPLQTAPLPWGDHLNGDLPYRLHAFLKQ